MIFRSAEAAERFGFDDAWVNDHLNFDWDQRVTAPVGTIDAVKDQEPNFFESVTTAAALLGRLQRIGIAIGGLALPLRDPRILAKQVTSMHELTGRRLTLGPAVGMIERSFEIMHVRFDRRGQLFDEYLAALHALCYAPAPVSFTGATIEFEGANFYPQPTGLRLLVAGENDRSLARAAEWGHGWLTSYPELGSYVMKVRRFRDLVSSRGREPDEMDTAALVFICIASTRKRALEISGPTLAIHFGTVEYARQVSIVGTAADAIDRLAAMYRAGIRYVQLRPVTGDPGAWIDMIQWISEDVLPAVRTTTERSMDI